MTVLECLKIKQASVFNRDDARGRLVFSLDRRGFTIVELIVVCAILGVLTSMAFPAYSNYIDIVRTGRSAGDIRALETAVSAYILDKNTLPTNFSDIGPSANQLDPWNRPYVYANLTDTGATPLAYANGKDLNDDYDLYSLGKNGTSSPGYDETSCNDDIVRVNDGQYIGLRVP